MDISEEDRALAEMESGFTGNDEEPLQEERPEETPEEKTQDTNSEAQEDKPEDKVVLAGYTEKQIQDLLGKASEVDAVKSALDERLGKVFGKFGAVNDELNQLKQRPSGIKLSAEKFARLSNDYGTELAEALASDLNEALSAGGNQLDPAMLSDLLDKRLADKKDPAEVVDILSLEHEDWKEIKDSQDFAEWKKTLPERHQQLIETSNNPSYASAVLTRYKASKPVKQDIEEKPKSNPKKRLESAVNPQGVPAVSSTKSALDEMMDGYNSA